MLGHRELTIADYAGILKRRLWLILASAVVLLVASVGITYIIPPRYESQTLVLIERQSVPEDYVKPVVGQDLDARLASMKEQILSRSRLEPIITKFKLYASANYTMDDRVDLTRKAIKINTIHPETRGSNGMPGFFVAFDASDPLTAQQVCGEITSLFVSENLTAREQSAEGTTDFLKQQLDDAKRNLDDQDAKLAAFQQKNFGRLPDQQSSNSNTLQALTTQLGAATDSLSRIQQNVTFLDAMVQQQARDLQGSDSTAGAVEDERKKELKDLLAQKQEMDLQLTPDHPDEIEIARKIADLQAKIAHAPVKASVSVPSVANKADSPQLQQLRAQLVAAQQSMVIAKRDQAQIQDKIRSYEARIESSPEVDEEYKKITRDHETALQFYNSLLTKMNESSMATALERRQQGEQFRVMDAPNLPDEPKFPNRLMFGGGGLVAGLFVGLLLAALLEYRDTTLRTEQDVWVFTKLPVLATISTVDDLAKTNKKTSREKHSSGSGKPISAAGD